ncbi:MAG TPA: 3-deoxy-7-phosphoheptulonate synthase [Casimicrobiaceae bacterium]|nr:3-deoxy-7-phosphoheptulonate synthase [Casimicrobiaceae bacterium]
MDPHSDALDDARIAGSRELVAPEVVRREYPISATVARLVIDARRAIHGILHGQDDRLIVIAGPCSIHDRAAALEYAQRLAAIARKHATTLLVLMRVYFEKPRTTIGWKGLINDPRLDRSFAINEGLRLAREILLNINALGLPAATEYLDMITPQYLSDLISWGAIGARTTESQVHRQLASGLSCPVGFKNGTDGDVKIAVDAVKAAAAPHHFLGATKAGHSAILETTGNEDCHVILRGGTTPNYDAASVARVAQALEAAGLAARIMIDCSHANSGKDALRQIDVAKDVAAQISAGDTRIMGVMLESHLNAGRQDLAPDKPLAYGISITDACLGWEHTVPLLDGLARAVQVRRGNAQERATGTA